MNASRPRRTAGFTLVELLVVIGVIAVLIGMLLPALNKARAQGRAVHCMANMRSIGQALMLYANANKGRFPVSVYISSYAVPDFGNPTVYDNWDFVNLPTEPSTPGMNFFGGLIRQNPGLAKSLVCAESEPYPGQTADKVATSYLVNGLMINRQSTQIKRPSEIAVVQEDRFWFNTSYQRPRRKSVDGATAQHYLGRYHSQYGDAFTVPFNSKDVYDYWSWQSVATGAIAEYANIHNHGANFLMADGHAEWMRYLDVKAQTFGLTSGPGVNGRPDDNYVYGYTAGRYYRSALDR